MPAGIGFECCVYLAENGAEVIAVTRTQADLDTLLKQCGADKIIPVLLDISDVAATKSGMLCSDM